MIGGLVIGGGATLLASAPTWIDASLTIDGLPTVVVSASGRTVAPFIPAVALLALGAAVALMLVGRIGQRVVGGIVAVLSIAAVAVGIDAISSTTAAVAGSLADAAGVSSIPPTATVVADATVWPWIALVATGVTIASALIATMARWPTRSRRYELAESAGSTAATGQTDPAAPEPDDGIGWWDALDRGEDPSARG